MHTHVVEWHGPSLSMSGHVYELDRRNRGNARTYLFRKRPLAADLPYCVVECSYPILHALMSVAGKAQLGRVAGQGAGVGAFI